MIQMASDISDFRKNLRVILDRQGRGAIAALARASDKMNRPFLQDLIAGRKSPSIETIYRIAGGLGIEPAVLLLDHEHFCKAIDAEGRKLESAISAALHAAIEPAAGPSKSVARKPELSLEQVQAMRRLGRQILRKRSAKKKP